MYIPTHQHKQTNKCNVVNILVVFIVVYLQFFFLSLRLFCLQFFLLKPIPLLTTTKTLINVKEWNVNINAQQVVLLLLLCVCLCNEMFDGGVFGLFGNTTNTKLYLLNLLT